MKTSLRNCSITYLAVLSLFAVKYINLRIRNTEYQFALQEPTSQTNLDTRRKRDIRRVEGFGTQVWSIPTFHCYCAYTFHCMQ